MVADAMFNPRGSFVTITGVLQRFCLRNLLLGLAGLTADGSCGLAGSKGVGKSTLVQHECLARPKVRLQHGLQHR